MIALHRRLPVENFEKPDSVVSMKVCSVSHMLATPSCPQPYDEYFIKGRTPEACDIHGPGKAKSENITNMFGPKDKIDTKAATKKRLMF